LLSESPSQQPHPAKNDFRKELEKPRTVLADVDDHLFDVSGAGSRGTRLHTDFRWNNKRPFLTLNARQSFIFIVFIVYSTLAWLQYLALYLAILVYINHKNHIT
jgi:hypothetical protein